MVGGIVGGGKLLTVKGEALPLVPSLVFVGEELEVVVGVFEGADLVIVVDEVALGGKLLVQAFTCIMATERGRRTRDQ
jgi:hypothetical protein